MGRDAGAGPPDPAVAVEAELGGKVRIVPLFVPFEGEVRPEGGQVVLSGHHCVPFTVRTSGAPLCPVLDHGHEMVASGGADPMDLFSGAVGDRVRRQRGIAYKTLSDRSVLP